VSLYLLDTNAVSLLLRGDPGYARRIIRVHMSSLRISSITEAELLFGVAQRPEAKRLHAAVKEFLKRVEVAAWDEDSAKIYGKLRAAMEKDGMPMGALDLLIAAHALSMKATLVTGDTAFSRVPGLKVVDWSSG
jgi:tRNA(fMet)-specific endonuclease VapC